MTVQFNQRMAIFFVLLLCVLSTSCTVNSGESPASKGVLVDEATKALFKPLPTDIASPENPLTDAKVRLGRQLYFDTRLSKSGAISCNTCHQLDRFGVDNQPVSTGHNGQKGGRNSPTVYQAAGHVTQFWDGRAPTVEEQAKGPILNPIEMAMPSADAVVSLLKGIPGYGDAFREAFPGDADPVTWNNLGLAIGAFERKLVTPSRFDRFLQGDTTILSEREKLGLNTFVQSGCVSCHNGTYVGGAMYQKIGLVHAWPNQKDLGRYDLTKQEGDRYIFKVPSLRNVEQTAPYFHDGSVATLEEAVRLMGYHQLGKTLTPEEISQIVDWLKTLTGDLPVELISQPKLP